MILPGYDLWKTTPSCEEFYGDEPGLDAQPEPEDFGGWEPAPDSSDASITTVLDDDCPF